MTYLYTDVHGYIHGTASAEIVWRPSENALLHLNGGALISQAFPLDLPPSWDVVLRDLTTSTVLVEGGYPGGDFDFDGSVDASHVYSLTVTSGNGALGGASMTLSLPADLVESLITDVQGLPDVKDGIKTALVAKLNAALAAWTIDDTASTCARIQDFINLGLAQAGKHLTAATAASLIEEAKAIRALIGCP